MVLFEKTSLLIIAFHENKKSKDILKYERISDIIKQFKLVCGYVYFNYSHCLLESLGQVLQLAQFLLEMGASLLSSSNLRITLISWSCIPTKNYVTLFKHT